MLTCAQIRQLAKENGITCPSLPKAQLLAYVQGVLTERANGYDPTVKLNIMIPFSILTPVSLLRPDDWKSVLRTYGVVVIPIKDFDPKVYVDHFWSWMESCNTATANDTLTVHGTTSIRRDDPSTWLVSRTPHSIDGMFKSFIGHQEWLWKIREACKYIFEEIWGTSDLLSSFDGASVLFPKGKTKNVNGTVEGSWRSRFHYDQGRFSETLCSIQGVVHLTDNGPSDGGFTFIEGSNDVFSDYLHKHPSSGYVWSLLDINDPLFQGKRMLKVCVPAGHILLFDSRIAHSISPTTSSNHRMVTYVSMMPRSGATDKEIVKRQKLYRENRMTGHWCYGPYFSETEKAPRVRGNAPVVTPLPFATPDYYSLSSVRQGMIGREKGPSLTLVD